MTNNLWRIRREKGLKQYQFAARLGIDQGTLSKIENNLKEPSWPFVVDCARILGVNPEELFPDLKPR